MRTYPRTTESVSRRRKFILPALAASAMLAIATPAAAAPADTAADEPCPFTDTLCLFEGENFTGERFNVRALNDGTCVSLVDHGWDGRVDSAINTNTVTAALFANDDCLGGPYQVPTGSIADLGGFEPLSLWVAG
ncbi:peptidase inhibitor family I36 protein [Glycomyces paridis]|uniref:Peptidase inhibitor family I36 protein n=1 Tax=Glycomyces paridis TaxID=2126555 RepID=A0A4S8PG84_9ACTN|nr:peptidase inhibitor family I36 protein [Glycomyces paridis]THV29527.1 hypothetical protein E9998_08460 [Glycomyces paridis]